MSREQRPGRTLMYDVASLVIHNGQATVNDIRPSFPDKTVYQIRKALHNGVAKGLIKCLHNGQQKGVHGCGAATYGPRDARPIGAPALRSDKLVANSVFDMGGVRLTEMARGTTCSPLGEW